MFFFPTEMLISSDKMELAAEAMHELGNLHFHITDVRFGSGIEISYSELVEMHWMQYCKCVVPRFVCHRMLLDLNYIIYFCLH